MKQALWRELDIDRTPEQEEAIREELFAELKAEGSFTTSTRLTARVFEAGELHRMYVDEVNEKPIMIAERDDNPMFGPR